MAKELPYFKFEPSLWDTGNIQLCAREDKGLFIDLCSIYWQRLGDLPLKLAVQKLCAGNATALNPLIETEIIKVIDGAICIDFLNEQLSEFENLSQQNSKNALDGWKKRKNATLLQPHSDRNTIRGEERKGEEIKVDESIEKENFHFFGSGEFDFILIPPKYSGDKWKKIIGGAGLNEFYQANMSSIKHPELTEKFLREKSGSHFEDFKHVHNTFIKFSTPNRHGKPNTNSAEVIIGKKQFAGKL